MKKQKINVGIILKDGLILFAISTVLVLVANAGFDLLKDKGVKDDPLVTAIHQDKLDELEKLAGSGKHALDVLDGQGRTALMQASYGNYNLPKRLKEADEKRAAMVVVLLKHGAPIDDRDKHDWTALMWASWSGMPKVTEELLKANASLTPFGKQGFTALALASMRGKDQVVKQLLEKGADRAVVTKAGKTPLDLAKAEMAKYSSDSESDQEKKARYEKAIALLEAR